MGVCLYFKYFKESVRIWVENRESCGRVYLFELSRTLKKLYLSSNLKEAVLCKTFLNISLFKKLLLTHSPRGYMLTSTHTSFSFFSFHFFKYIPIIIPNANALAPIIIDDVLSLNVFVLLRLPFNFDICCLTFLVLSLFPSSKS